MQHIRSIIMALAVVLAAMSPRAAMAGDLGHPVIKGFGGIHALPRTAVQPDATRSYKAIFDVTKGAKTPEDVNAGLFHVAKAVNLLASAGVPLKHMHIVAVLHGKATPAALDDAHYKKLFGVNNPNTPLLKELRQAGVDVYVCSQAMLKKGYKLAWANPYITPALSALTTLIVFGNEGYAYVKQ